MDKGGVRWMVLVCAMLLALAWAGVAAAKCPDATVKCWGASPDVQGGYVMCGTITVDTKYNYTEMVCKPTMGGCAMRDACKNAYPSCCSTCSIFWKGWQGSHRACPSGFRPPE